MTIAQLAAALQGYPPPHTEAYADIVAFLTKLSWNRFYINDYGAVADLERSINVSVSGTNLVNSTGFTPFTGKKVFLISMSLASGSGINDHVTLGSYVNSTTVALDDAAPAVVNGSLAYWGSEGSTTATNVEAMQAAVEAASLNKGGRVIAQGCYMMHGDITTTISYSGVGIVEYNSVITFPPVTYFDNAFRPHIVIDGDAVPPNFTQNGPGNVGYTRPPLTGTTFLSTCTSNVADSFFFNCSGVGTSVSFNYTYVTYTNFTLLVPANGKGVGAGIGGINARTCVSTMIKYVVYGISESLPLSAEPRNWVVGFAMNDRQTDSMCALEYCHSYGAYDGYELGEHDTFNHIQAFGCYYALNMKDAAFLVNGNTFLVHWCKNCIRATGPSTVMMEMVVEPWGNYWFAAEPDGIVEDIGPGVGQGNLKGLITLQIVGGLTLVNNGVRGPGTGVNIQGTFELNDAT